MPWRLLLFVHHGIGVQLSSRPLRRERLLLVSLLDGTPHEAFAPSRSGVRLSPGRHVRGRPRRLTVPQSACVCAALFA